jgi:hypothetical protein
MEIFCHRTYVVFARKKKFSTESYGPDSMQGLDAARQSNAPLTSVASHDGVRHSYIGQLT